MQVYVLGESMAVPLNYLQVKIDDAQVDWLGCETMPPALIVMTIDKDLSRTLGRWCKPTKSSSVRRVYGDMPN
jgi:hypothetical protein